MIENDNPRVGARLAIPFAPDGGPRPNTVAVKHGSRKIYSPHGKIANCGAKRRVGYRHSNHECKGEQAVDYWSAIFRLGRFVKIDVQGLCVQRQIAEPEVVRLN